MPIYNIREYICIIIGIIILILILLLILFIIILLIMSSSSIIIITSIIVIVKLSEDITIRPTIGSKHAAIRSKALTYLYSDRLLHITHSTPTRHDLGLGRMANWIPLRYPSRRR